MKVYLDDIRPTPVGWVHAYWPDEVITHLLTGEVTELSLDHDLGDDTRGTGYDVVCWLEKHVFENPDFVVPEVRVHSANPIGRNRMEAAMAAIKERMK